MLPGRTGFVSGPQGRLWWQVVGEGPALVLCNGLGVGTFFWKHLVADLARSFSVVQWHYPGHGSSDRVAEPSRAMLGPEELARCLGAVQDALQLGPAVLVGHSLGCQVILERYRQAPDAVAGLVPMLGSAGKVLQTFGNSDGDAERVFRRVEAAFRVAGPLLNHALHAGLRSPLAWAVTRQLGQVDRHLGSYEDFTPYFDHLADMDLRLFVRLVRLAHEHDAFDVLATIRVPTLVVGADRDAFTPVFLARRMAALIPGAELIILAEGTHAALIEQPETIAWRLRRFLRERLGWDA